MSGILSTIFLIFVVCIVASITLIVFNPRTIVSNVIDKPWGWFTQMSFHVATQFRQWVNASSNQSCFRLDSFGIVLCRCESIIDDSLEIIIGQTQLPSNSCRIIMSILFAFMVLWEMQVGFLILSFMRLQRVDDRYFPASLQECFNTEIRDGWVRAWEWTSDTENIFAGLGCKEIRIQCLYR